MGTAIGIDLGTTNTVVSFVENNQPVIIPNNEGSRLTPSVVGYKDGRRLVGKSAKRQVQLHPHKTIHSIKRFMGRRYSEAMSDFRLVNFDLHKSANGDCHVEVEGREYTPQEISAFILREVKNFAEDHIGETITQAVVTVPAYFNDRQRQATKDAGALAGLDILRVINEPTAAALAYTFAKRGQKRIAVYDFGGGTFDISILELDKDVAEVIATRGDNSLGGNDVDNALEEWVIKEFHKEHQVNLNDDHVAKQRIKDEAERVKIELSASKNSAFNLPFLYSDENGPKNFHRKFTREEFNTITLPIIQRTINETKLALQDAKLNAGEIDEVVIVGGSSRIPIVQDLLKTAFPCRLNKSFNPEEVVALGAAIQASNLSGNAASAVTLLDVTAFSLGIEVSGGRFAPLIYKNSTIPTEVTKRVTTTIDNQRTVKIHVLQGESDKTSENTSLGEFELGNIQPAPAKAPQIEVRFAIDSNGMVQVSAKDLRTGVKEEISIDNTDGLTRSALDQMKERMNRELVGEESQEQTQSDSAAKADGPILDLRKKIENKLVSIDHLINAHQGTIHKNTVDQVVNFQRRARSALTKSNDERRLNQLFAQINKLHSDLESQLPS